MSRTLEKAKELRNTISPHYNCAQGVFMPFAQEAGMSEDTAYKVAANFGAGMKTGAVCGAVTGALMALGLNGIADQDSVEEVFNSVRASHGGCVNCSDLLKRNAEEGGDKKAHCDGLVYECVGIVEKLIG